MQKIPFDIKYRPEIESGKYQVETRSGRPVRIICWDAKNEDPLVQLPIVGLVDYGKREMVFTWDNRGLYGNNDMDLIIVTDWKDLEDVNKHLINLLSSMNGELYKDEEINEIAEKETKALCEIFKEVLLPVELSKPVEKLITEIERRREKCADIAADERNKEVAEYYRGKVTAYDEISFLIASLQQEQPERGNKKGIEL